MKLHCKYNIFGELVKSIFKENFALLTVPGNKTIKMALLLCTIIIHHWSYTSGESSNRVCVCPYIRQSSRLDPYLSNRW